ncbi:hypothetical protein SDC9_192826 [bioreactor metagenome]|uniref:Orn/Lys/Arg decarboxylases family 1 pyridoxal-P attachment site domain-containing protein n=1 Tax=bioreactor metagenome TaxID=1076179 RepID=A0A645I478_9ZZZZ
METALNLISTTSPSYPILASIEKNINFLNSNKGRQKINELINNIEKIKNNLENLESIKFYKGKDPTKILTRIQPLKGVTLKGFELSEILLDKYKIEDEITNEKSTMFLCGIGTDLKKLKRLESALKNISKNLL